MGYTRIWCVSRPFAVELPAGFPAWLPGRLQQPKPVRHVQRRKRHDLELDPRNDPQHPVLL